MSPRSHEDLVKTVIRVLRDVMKDKGLPVSSITLESPVDRTFGLDSLDWAAVVVRLEEELGVDPFQAGLERELRTVGDFVELYKSTLDAS